MKICVGDLKKAAHEKERGVGKFLAGCCVSSADNVFILIECMINNDLAELRSRNDVAGT